MMNSFEIFVTVAVIVLGTVITRFIAFVVFPADKEVPEFVSYLGRTLPAAVFGLLLVYCLKGVNLLGGSHGLPELIALGVVALLHIKWRQILLSIAGGTVCYMLLVQLVFV